MNTAFKGTGVAIVTPFLDNEMVDFNGLTKVIHHIVNSGVDFIVSLGTTGETATLDNDEQKEVVQHTINIVDGRVPLMVGCGGNNTSAVISKMTEVETWGNFDGFLSVSPYYNKPSQEGIYQHFKHIAQATPKNIVLYNVPGRTAKNMEVDTICRLANDFDNIIGIKEAGGDLEQCKQLIKQAPKDFLILSGDDDLIVEQMKIGFHGTISVVANAFPKQWSSMLNCLLENKNEEAQPMFDSLLEFTNLIFEENNPAGVKCALNELGFIKNQFRLPIVPVSTDLEKRIRSFVQLKKDD